MEGLLKDIRYALRALRRSPGFTAVAVLTIALGIGASTTVFSVLNALLLRPLAVTAPSRLVSLKERSEGFSRMQMGQSAFSYPRYQAYRDATRHVFSDLVGQNYTPVSLRMAGGAESRIAVIATGNYFTTLGLRPALGRFFVPADAAEPAAVISSALWRERFASDPAVLDSTLWVNGRALPIIGVAPAGYGGTMAVAQADVWLSAETARAMGALGGEQGSQPSALEPWLLLFGRLRPGVAPTQASAAVNAAAHAIPADEPGAKIREAHVEQFSALPGVLRNAAWMFMAMLLATGLLVLLIASANVAGVLLARAAARRREIAVRLAIGAGRARLVRQMVTESATLFLLGGGAGIVLSAWALALLERLPSPVPGVRIALDFPIDVRVLAFALTLALATGLAFGLTPALRATRGQLAPTLRDRAGAGRRDSRVRAGFVVAQVAMSALLLLTAGLFARALQRTLHSDPGFDARGVVVATVDLAPLGYDEARGRAFYRSLSERLAALPDVQEVGLARFSPLSGSRWTTRVDIAGTTDASRGASVDAQVVDDAFLSVLRIPLVAGRGFGAADREGSAQVAVINATMARRFWPGESPIGRTVRLDGHDVQVVGVAADARTAVEVAEPVPVLYLPFAQNYNAQMVLHVRSRGDAARTLAAVRRELRALDPDVAPMQSQPLTDMIRATLLPQRIGALAVGAFGLAGLLLAAIGVYGVLAYQVSMRTREIGIRVALGAPRQWVVADVVRSGLRLAMIGSGIGLVAALGLSRLLASVLFAISPADPVAFGAVALLLLGVALVASYLPARRATRVDPVVALRVE